MTVQEIKNFLDENYTSVSQEEYLNEKHQLLQDGAFESSVKNRFHNFFLEGVGYSEKEVIMLYYAEGDVFILGCYLFTDPEKQYFPNWAIQSIDEDMGWVK